MDPAESLRPTESAEPAVRPRRPRRAVRPGAEQTSVAGPSVDETPQGWGEDGADGRSDSNDERLRRDVPPHY